MKATDNDCLLLPLSARKDGVSGGYPGHWNARFIWALPSDEASAAEYDSSIAKPLYRMFRKTFRVDNPHTKASLRITAGNNFIVYCNGTYLGRGPCRSLTTQSTFYDTYDISSCIRQGDNFIAAMVFWHGCPNAICMDQRAGLWAEADIELPSGKLMRVYTGPSWKTKACKGYDSDAPLVNRFHGLRVECYRAGLDPSDWMCPEFNDGDWDKCGILSTTSKWEPLENASCWEHLEPRLTPTLDESAVKALSILSMGYIQSDGTPQEPSAVAERLDKSTYTPCALNGVNIESLLDGKAAFASCEKGDPYLLLDFGRPYNAVPCVILNASDGDTVEFAYSNNQRDGRCVGFNNANKFAAAYTAKDGQQYWHLWNVPTAFRYLTVVFRTGSRPIALSSCHIIAHTYPATVTGSFHCSDRTLNTLWKASVDTNLMHLQDTYIMDPVRERVSYILAGEMEQSHLCYYISCGDVAATDTHFKLTARSQLSNGVFPLYTPSINHRGFFKKPQPFASSSFATIPGYLVFYSQAVVRRQAWFPKDGFLEEQYPVLQRAAQWLLRQTDENGLLYNIPPIYWLDWPLQYKWEASGCTGAMLGYNAVYIGFLSDMARCADKLGYPADAQKWQRLSDRTRSAVQTLFWNEEKGLFADYYSEDGPMDSYGELLNALALLNGVADAHQKKLVLKNLKEQPEYLTLVSPLYFFYVIEALCACGEDAYAFDYLSRRYRSIMDGSDFPTLPESWGEFGSKEDGFVNIHGGGGGVAFSLTTRLLGIMPLTEGFEQFRFQPCPGNVTHASGAVPSPRGLILAAWRIENRQFIMELTIPQDSSCRIYMPNGYLCKDLPDIAGPGKYRFIGDKI